MINISYDEYYPPLSSSSLQSPQTPMSIPQSTSTLQIPSTLSHTSNHMNFNSYIKFPNINQSQQSVIGTKLLTLFNMLNALKTCFSIFKKSSFILLI